MVTHLKDPAKYISPQKGFLDATGKEYLFSFISISVKYRLLSEEKLYIAKALYRELES